MATAAIGFLVNQYGPGVVEKVEGGDPVRIDFDYDNDRYGDGWSMATSRELDVASAPRPGSDCLTVFRWVRDAGAALVDESWARIVIEGRREKGVLISSMRARSLERGPPLSGSYVACPTAGAQENIAVGFDLDGTNPVARAVSEEGTFGDPYFSNHSITLAKGEKTTLSLVGKTTREFHRWVVDVQLIVDGKKETVTIGRGGFRTTAAADEYATSWDWAWWKEPSRFVRGDRTPRG